MNRIIKSIPNTITSMNLVCGIISIILSNQSHFEWAVLFILFASLFDFCDGFAARLLSAYSDMGKELDSLSDLVSFGLAPSFILYNYMSQIAGISGWMLYIPFIIALFSALRLAKFNVDDRQSVNFLGLPTPACGLMTSFLILFTTHSKSMSAILAEPSIIPALSVVLSILLVCNIPMFSLKFKSLKWAGNECRYLFLINIIPIPVLCIIFNAHWSGIVFFLFLYYILWNLVWYLVSLFPTQKIEQ